MMHYVLGYGSLMHPKSAGRTLGYVPTGEDLTPVRLPGWQRVWRAVSTREFPLADGTVRRPVFLDVMPAPPGSVLNGIVLRVDDEGLAALDRREMLYDRQDVASSLSPALPGPVWIYVTREEHRKLPEDAAVLDDYEGLVERSLQLWGPGFKDEYYASTIPHNLPRIAAAPDMAKRYRV